MFIKKIIKNIKEKIRNKLKVMIGIDIIQEEIDSVYYILDKGIDIKAFPKAEGALREYQLAETELLRIFHEVCRKLNLTYWLDWGTLLGAVRHNGFIPWDDDLDVAMPREDYNKAKTVLVDEFSRLGFNTVIKNAIYIWNEKIGVALDIFAVDSVEYDGDIVKLQKKAKDFYSECIRIYEPGGWRNMEDVDELREKMIPAEKGKLIYYNAVETCGRLYAFKPEDIFPLKKHTFEQYEFFVPNNENVYVGTQYSDYLSYPRQGILHHAKSGVPIYLKAAENNESLVDFTAKLSEISIN